MDIQCLTWARLYDQCPRMRQTGTNSRHLGRTRNGSGEVTNHYHWSTDDLKCVNRSSGFCGIHFVLNTDVEITRADLFPQWSCFLLNVRKETCTEMNPGKISRHCSTRWKIWLDACFGGFRGIYQYFCETLQHWSFGWILFEVVAAGWHLLFSVWWPPICR